MSDRVEMVADQEETGQAGIEADIAAEQAVVSQGEGEPVVESAQSADAVAETTPEAVAAPAGAAPLATSVASSETPGAAQTASAPVEQAAAPGTEAASAATSSAGGARKVRVLSVGQQVEGTVKRITDFGAFVDIGVGRDGLIHVSELSVRRVGKVTDVLSEGQSVTAWIKKLDRERNRISLTLVDPNTKTIRDLQQGEIVRGTVTRIMSYGAFVDIGIGRDALLHVREMSEGFVAKPEDVVKVGDTVEARIIELSRRRGRVDLSLKGLRPEPEPPAPPALQPPREPSGRKARPEPQPEPEPEPAPAETLEEIEALSPMEAAFKRAMEAEGMAFKVNRKKQHKRNRRARDHELLDDIITRTLSSGRK